MTEVHLKPFVKQSVIAPYPCIRTIQVSKDSYHQGAISTWSLHRRCTYDKTNDLRDEMPPLRFLDIGFLSIRWGISTAAFGVWRANLLAEPCARYQLLRVNPMIGLTAFGTFRITRNYEGWAFTPCTVFKFGLT